MKYCNEIMKIVNLTNICQIWPKLNIHVVGFIVYFPLLGGICMFGPWPVLPLWQTDIQTDLFHSRLTLDIKQKSHFQLCLSHSGVFLNVYLPFGCVDIQGQIRDDVTGNGSVHLSWKICPIWKTSIGPKCWTSRQMDSNCHSAQVPVNTTNWGLSTNVPKGQGGNSFSDILLRSLALSFGSLAIFL